MSNYASVIKQIYKRLMVNNEFECVFFFMCHLFSFLLSQRYLQGFFPPCAAGKLAMVN